MDTEEIAILNEYRLALDETWRTFSARFDMTHQRLYQVLKGINGFDERTAYRLHRYIAEHRAEIEAVLDRPLESEAAKHLPNP